MLKLGTRIMRLFRAFRSDLQEQEPGGDHLGEQWQPKVSRNANLHRDAMVAIEARRRRSSASV